MCNEYRLPTDFSALFDRFAEIRIPFRWADEPTADLKRHVFPKHQTVALRPVDATDPWAGFEGLVMTWGVPMMVFDPKKGKPVLRQPNNARDDKIEGRGWKDAYLHRRCLIPVREFMEWEKPEGYKPGGPVKAIKHTVQLEAALRVTGDGVEPLAFFPAIWTPAAAGDAPSTLTVANVTGPPAPDVPFHDRLARLVDLRAGVAWCDLQGQGIGALKVTPPAGTYRVALA